LPAFTVVNDTVEPQATARQDRQVLGKHPGQEEGKVANVLAHLLLAQTTGAASTGFDSTSISPTSSSRLPWQLRKEIVDMDEVNQQIAHVGRHFVVGGSSFATKSAKSHRKG
jgi:hypothetical protein